MASSSNASLTKASSSSSADSGNGFMEILSAQEALFAQTDALLMTLVSKEPGEDGQVSFEHKTIRSMKDLFGNLKEFFLLFQHRAIDEITVLETALRESKAREVEWKELADLFSQYRTKVSGEMMSMKGVIESYSNIKEELQAQVKEREAEVSRLQDELVNTQDLLLRVQSVGRRRANILNLEADIAEEEAGILKSIARLRAAADASEK